jgi:flagellar export protein FliJ
MSEEFKKRAKRMQRLHRIADALAKAAEGEMRDRQNALEEEQKRLDSVKAYRDEYSQMALQRESRAVQARDLTQGRDFAVWLMSVENNQLNTVERCQFVAESAREGAMNARRFASGLELIADKRREALVKYQAKQEQNQLDELRPVSLR